MENIGIWIDARRAYIIRYEDKIGEVREIESNVDEGVAKGGYGGPDKHLGQIAVSEPSVQKRKEQELKEFFHRIVNKLPETDKLFVFGPGEAKMNFAKTARRMHEMRKTEIVTETADSMPESKMKEKVRDFYGIKI